MGSVFIVESVGKMTLLLVMTSVKSIMLKTSTCRAQVLCIRSLLSSIYSFPFHYTRKASSLDHTATISSLSIITSIIGHLHHYHHHCPTDSHAPSSRWRPLYTRAAHLPALCVLVWDTAGTYGARQNTPHLEFN